MLRMDLSYSHLNMKNMAYWIIFLTQLNVSEEHITSVSSVKE